MKIKKQWAILFTVLPITFMSTLDSSIVNVALPIMAEELGTNMNGIQWIVSIYLITICASILLFGKLGDMYGKKRIFKLGIGLFTLGSLLCGISTNLVFLVLSRIIQAIGAAASMATNQGIITEAFPENERGRALGLIGSAVALGTMVGPTLGGAIVSFSKWNYIFLINIPVGVVAYIAVLKILKSDTKTKKTSLDLKGFILMSMSVVLLFGAINLGQVKGYNNPKILICAFVAFLLFIIFIKVESKEKNPLLDISIFKNKLFSLSLFCGFTSFIAIGAINIILPFYLENALELSPKLAGIILTVSPIILAVISPISGYLSDKIGKEKISLVGCISIMIGVFLLTILDVGTPLIIVAILIGLMSIGNGMFQSPNNSIIMSTVEKTQLGVAGSINGLVRNVGLTTGISLSTSLLYGMMSSKIGYKVVDYVNGRADVFVYGMRWVFIVVGCICLLGAILTIFRVKQSKTLL